MARWIFGLGLVLTLAACDTGGSPDPTDATTVDPPPVVRDIDGNTMSGLGWELLEFTRSGLTYGVAVAENEVDTERMWASLPFDVAAPELNYATHVLMVLGHAVSGSCPEIQFQGLTIEPDRVYGEFTFRHDRGACTADANPAAYLLAVERAALPDQFLLTLEAEDICRGCDEDTILVDLTSDDPDDAYWWAKSRFGIVIGGAPPVDSHVFLLRYGERIEPLAIPAADWPTHPQWISGGENFPDRVEAFTANCIGGEDCIEDLDSLEATGPVCGTNIDSAPRQDVAITITFAQDGSCEIEQITGSDGTEFNVPDSELDT